MQAIRTPRESNSSFRSQHTCRAPFLMPLSPNNEYLMYWVALSIVLPAPKPPIPSPAPSTFLGVGDEMCLCFVTFVDLRESSLTFVNLWMYGLGIVLRHHSTPSPSISIPLRQASKHSISLRFGIPSTRKNRRIQSWRYMCQRLRTIILSLLCSLVSNLRRWQYLLVKEGKVEWVRGGEVILEMPAFG